MINQDDATHRYIRTTTTWISLNHKNIVHTLKTLKQLNSDGKKTNNFDDEKIKRPTKPARIKTVNQLVRHTF